MNNNLQYTDLWSASVRITSPVLSYLAITVFVSAQRQVHQVFSLLLNNRVVFSSSLLIFLVPRSSSSLLLLFLLLQLFVYEFLVHSSSLFCIFSTFNIHVHLISRLLVLRSRNFFPSLSDVAHSLACVYNLILLLVLPDVLCCYSAYSC